VSSARRRALGILTLASALAAPACLHGEEPADPSPCYPGVFAQDPGAPGSGSFTLVVGADDPAQGRVGAVWHDGDHVALVRGGQGGFMIRPALDVTTPAALPETGGLACIGVRMTASAPADAGPTLAGVKAKRVPGTAATYHIPALFGLLSFGSKLDGVTVAVTLDAQQVGVGDGHAQVTVVPDSSLH
jgi:hypothetical protein